jgi:hypothetical protein
VQKDGLGLVVASVAGRDAGAVVLGRDTPQELVASPASIVLGLRRRLRSPEADGRADPRGEIRDELRLGGASPASAVVEVGDVQDEREVVREVREEQEHRCRVRTARDGDHDRARGQQIVLEGKATHGVADM